MKCQWMFVFLITTLILVNENLAAKGGKGRGKGKGKNLLAFSNVAEYSLVQQTQGHPRVTWVGATIVKGSHFSQIYRLAFKIWLICVAKGDPRPKIIWYKDGSEMPENPNSHIYENKIGEYKLWSKIEIDPATMGDQGIYTCMANNEYGLMVKNFKCEYTY